MSGRDDMTDLTCDEVREMAGAFVLDALEPADEAAVRAHLATCDDAHAEIGELGSVVPALAETVPQVEAPAGLKARIMAAAAADLEERTQGPAGVAPAAGARVAAATTLEPAGTPAEPTAFPSAEERTARRARTSAGTWVLRAAAVLAIVALSGWNLLLQNQLNASQMYEQSVAAVLDVAAQPGSLTAILTPDDGTGSGLAAVAADGKVTLAMQDLAPTTGSTVYTAWAIGGDGVPVALGDFTVGSNGTASFTAPTSPVASGTVLALTREPNRGATTPTLPIVSKGVATAPA